MKLRISDDLAPSDAEPTSPLRTMEAVNPRLTFAIHTLQSVAADLVTEGLFSEAEATLGVAIRVAERFHARMFAAQKMAAGMSGAPSAEPVECPACDQHVCPDPTHAGYAR